MGKMKLSDIFRMIGKDCYWHYHPKTNEVNTIQYFYRQERSDGNIDFDEKIGEGISGELIRLPSYEDIDNKSIMSYYVRDCVEDKETRRKLFYILRNHDFMDKFLAAVKELELYDDYIMVTDDIYEQLAEEWAEKNGILSIKQREEASR